MRVPIKTRIKNLSQHLRKRIAYSKTCSSKGHIIREHLVLSKTLRIRPNIVPQPIIVFRQCPDQVFRQEDRIIVSKHEPPHVRMVQAHDLRHHAGDPYSRAEPVPERVAETGRVLRNAYGRERTRIILD